MRSSKSRSRSKQNRPRTIGNIVNRVFDSSGPEGKVRGTPQQIIEKYQALARDAQLSNDRVAAENFLQHAEHYTRMLGEAMREMAVEQEARRQYQGAPGNGQNGNGHGQHGGDRGSWQQNRREDRGDEQPEIGAVPVFAFEEAEQGARESSLVETPEDRAEAGSAAPAPMADEFRPTEQPQRRATLKRSDSEPREPREGREQREPREIREPREVREPREPREARDDSRGERRSEPKRDNRRKDDRRYEERKPRDVTPVTAAAVSTPVEAPVEAPAAAEAEPAARPAAKPRRTPSPRSKPKAAPAEAAALGDSEA